MRVLITGINGFVAGHLAEHLLQLPDCEVWGQSRGATLQLPQLRGRVRLIQADLHDAVQTEHMLNRCHPDAVVHLAAQAFVPASFHDPTATLMTNIVGQVNLLQAIIQLHIDPVVLVICSNEEYGMVRPEELPIDEQTPLRPASPYAVSKVTQDMLALQYFQSHHLKTIRLRPFNHIGPRQNDRFVASAFARQIAYIEAGIQKPVMRVGNLSAERDFTDVRDMVAAYALAITHCVPGEVYNIGSGTAVSIQQILSLLLEQSGAHVDIIPDPELIRPVDIPQVISNAERFRAQTGWRPQIMLRQTLSDILDDWRLRIKEEQISS